MGESPVNQPHFTRFRGDFVHTIDHAPDILDFVAMLPAFSGNTGAEPHKQIRFLPLHLASLKDVPAFRFSVVRMKIFAGKLFVGMDLNAQPFGRIDHLSKDAKLFAQVFPMLVSKHFLRKLCQKIL